MTSAEKCNPKVIVKSNWIMHLENLDTPSLRICVTSCDCYPPLCSDMPFHKPLTSQSESFLIYLTSIISDPIDFGSFNLWAGDDPICRGGQWSGVPGQWQEAAGEENQVGNHWRYNSHPFFLSHLNVFPFLFVCSNLYPETLLGQNLSAPHN